MFKDAKNYDMNSRSLANRTRTVSDETRAKMSALQKGRTITWAHKVGSPGRVVSEETRAKLSAALKGRTAPNKGIQEDPLVTAKRSHAIIFRGEYYPSKAAAKRATGCADLTLKKYAVEVDNT